MSSSNQRGVKVSRVCDTVNCYSNFWDICWRQRRRFPIIEMGLYIELFWGARGVYVGGGEGCCCCDWLAGGQDVEWMWVIWIEHYYCNGELMNVCELCDCSPAWAWTRRRRSLSWKDKSSVLHVKVVFLRTASWNSAGSRIMFSFGKITRRGESTPRLLVHALWVLHATRFHKVLWMIMTVWCCDSHADNATSASLP